MKEKNENKLKPAGPKDRSGRSMDMGEVEGGCVVGWVWCASARKNDKKQKILFITQPVLVSLCTHSLHIGVVTKNEAFFLLLYSVSAKRACKSHLVYCLS